MTGQWLKLLEAHVEKGILGLTGLALLAMFWLYFIRSPNTIDEYQGRELGPRGLYEAIHEDAQALEVKVRNATADDPKVEDFSKQLKDHHAEGIFATAAKQPPLAPELRRAAIFGSEIVVPGLKDSEEAAGSIALVTPLKPKPLKTRTGRSLAVREPVEVSGLEEPAAVTTPPDEPAEPVEVAWVTVAAYFDKKAQYNEMIKAGYVPFRSKAYVAGVDVQREEMLSNGEFSEWQDVEPTMAMPKFELPEPQFDDQTGELVNKDGIRETFEAVKYAQPTLMQPPFYEVEAGDFWGIPPLEGYEEEEEEPEDEDFGKKTEQPRVRVPPPVRTGPPGGGRRPGPGGRTPGPLVGGGRSGRGSGAISGARTEAERKREARKQIRRDLKEVKRLLGQNEYAAARDLASRIIGNDFASTGDKRDAQRFLRHAERGLERQSGQLRGRGVGRVAEEVLTHPETGQPAVWFHDDTVEAGKTYRYRMRVKLWNRYVGRMRSLQDPEQAKQTVVDGEWSLESEPITVTPSTYFFFSGSRPPQTASVQVWKWRGGRWLEQRFDVSVGDVIGGERKIKTGEYDEEGDEIKAPVDFTTGAVVLDLRFDEPLKERWRGKDEVFGYRDRTSTVMAYLDPADGQVKERVLVFDRRDPKRKELEDQAW